MRQIAASKSAELATSAKLPFSEKLALIHAIGPREGHLVLSETLEHPVFEIIKRFNLALRQGIFARYAFAGGLAVQYYGAPISTLDADFLVVFPQTPGGFLDPSRFYEFFESHGATKSGECLVLHGLKFQMIPANNELATEALEAAASVSEKGILFFVVTLEHLIALKLGAWRYKDRLHVSHLLDSGAAVDIAKLVAILDRHGLRQRWQQLLSERAAGSGES